MAAVAFGRDGSDASLKAIAKEAGVGIGTLYRRFPTREDLVEATYRSETSRLCDDADDLLAVYGPVDGLRQWGDRFLRYMHVKQGMADALPRILTAQEGLRLQSRARIRDAIAVFLDAGQASRVLREDTTPELVMLALGGTTLITEHEHDHASGGALLDLLLDGLRARE
ncbi:MAG: helix-turn-helix domain-containing protein [Curtobacterium sp.]